MQKRIGIVQPLLLAIVIAVGFGIVWAVLVNWGISTTEDLFGPEWMYEGVAFRMDGTPVLQTCRGRNENNVTYRTLDGTAITISRQEVWLQGAWLDAAREEHSYATPFWYGESGWSQAIATYNDGGTPATYWYFICNCQASDAYFVGFDSVGKQRVGSIGPDGFQEPTDSSAKHFAVSKYKYTRARGIAVGSYYGDGNCEPWYAYSSGGSERFPPWLVFVLTDDGVIEVDLLNRSTRAVLKEADAISAGYLWRGLASPLTTDSDAHKTQISEYLAVRTNDRILLLDTKGRLDSSFVIPLELRDAGFSFYRLHDNSGVFRVSDNRLRHSKDESYLDRLVWADATGKILHQQECTLMLSGSYDRAIPPWQASTSVPAPLAVATTATVFQPWLYLWQDAEPDIPAALSRSWSEFWLPMAAVSILGVVLAYLCYRRQRKYGLPWTGVWMVFVLLFGLPAYLGYLAHRAWPARLPCPNCGQLAPRDRPTCLACGKEFPTPAMKGIEVFA